MWSKAILCRFLQSGKIPQTQASQGFAAFRLTPSRIQPRHSQSRCATSCATPGYSVFYPAGRILPKQTSSKSRTLYYSGKGMGNQGFFARQQSDTVSSRVQTSAIISPRPIHRPYRLSFRGSAFPRASSDSGIHPAPPSSMAARRIFQSCFIEHCLPCSDKYRCPVLIIIKLPVDCKQLALDSPTLL